MTQNPKSRGNWHIPWQEERYERIFGHKGAQLDPGEQVILPKTKVTLLDQPNMKAVIKIGKEINKFKDRDRKRFAGNKALATEVDRRFKVDTEKIMKPKENTELNKQMGKTYIENYKRELAQARR